MQVCNLGPHSAVCKAKKKFEMTAHEGCWKRRVNAGGCLNYHSQYTVWFTASINSCIRLFACHRWLKQHVSGRPKSLRDFWTLEN